MGTILVIEDTDDVREDIRDILAFEGYDVLDVADGASGLELARDRRPDLIICDIMMPAFDGYDVLTRLRRDPVTADIPVIFLTAKAAREDMRKGMSLGADDYVTKPFTATDVLDAVRARLERHRGVTIRVFDTLLAPLVGAMVKTGKELDRRSDGEAETATTAASLDRMIGSSDEMQAVFSMVQSVAGVDVPVLILGETGTGKELVAHALHELSARQDKPFVSVNCAAIPSELVESELFGHEKGSFTGAHQQRTGRAEQAEGGTLFLDEIGEMPTTLQAKLLRFLEEHTFERVGGNRPIEANVRIIAATNRDVGKAIREQKLRMDLLYRLNTITVVLPPLRERKGDIASLADHFVRQANATYRCAVRKLDAKVLDMLVAHSWPGNVRQLRNIIDRAVILTGKGTIRASAIHLETPLDSIDAPSRQIPAAQEPAEASDEGTEEFASVSPYSDRPLMELKRELVEQFERTYMDNLLKRFKGNVTRSARAARMDKKNFIEKMQRYEMKREDYLS